MVGEFPGLKTGLDEDGNVRATADFRGVYASLLEQWLGIDAGTVIPGAASFTRPVLSSDRRAGTAFRARADRRPGVRYALSRRHDQGGKVILSPNMAEDVHDLVLSAPTARASSCAGRPPSRAR